ncbi:MAG: tRNA pseudouridine55 synthase [Patescibacteria group bacterium]|nr:tRNA pseudouridine55 synthase [Patescibacteria group bacterium]
MYLSYKNIGETPLECLERIRAEYGKPKDIPMTYAGRLDPMAEGLLIILAGEDCKDKERYLKMDKEYEVEVLFGVSTDTYDQLGLIESSEKKDFDAINFDKYKGKFTQEYPKYSSKVLAMREVPDEMPTKDVEIFLIEQIGSKALSGQRISETILENIKKVTGDFRQEEISTKWREFGEKFATTRFIIIKLKVACSSGTYMRSLANRIGIDAGIPAMAYSIKRTRINGYKI